MAYPQRDYLWWICDSVSVESFEFSPLLPHVCASSDYSQCPFLSEKEMGERNLSRPPEADELCNRRQKISDGASILSVRMSPIRESRWCRQNRNGYLVCPQKSIWRFRARHDQWHSGLVKNYSRVKPTIFTELRSTIQEGDDCRRNRNDHLIVHKDNTWRFRVRHGWRNVGVVV